VGRSLVARRVRLNDRVGGLADQIIRRERRHGFEEVVARLTRPSPRLLRRRSLAAVGLFEVWMHHEDVAVPNDVAHEERPGLDAVLTWLTAYQSRSKEAVPFTLVSSEGQAWRVGSPGDGAPVVRGAIGDLVRWCAGRPVRAPLAISGADELVIGLDAFHPHV
jgi:uncharacterized protein (TIGR03083 family)